MLVRDDITILNSILFFGTSIHYATIYVVQCTCRSFYFHSVIWLFVAIKIIYFINLHKNTSLLRFSCFWRQLPDFKNCYFFEVIRDIYRYLPFSVHYNRERVLLLFYILFSTVFIYIHLPISYICKTVIFFFFFFFFAKNIFFLKHFFHTFFILTYLFFLYKTFFSLHLFLLAKIFFIFFKLCFALHFFKDFISCLKDMSSMFMIIVVYFFEIHCFMQLHIASCIFSFNFSCNLILFLLINSTFPATFHNFI